MYPACAGTSGCFGFLHLDIRLIANPSGAVVPLDEPVVAAALLVVAAPLAGGCAGCAQLVLEPVAALALWTLGSLLTVAELLSFLMNLLLLLLVLTTLPPCYSKNHEYLSSIKNLSSIEPQTLSSSTACVSFFFLIY